jgi:hypothetical protein
MTDENGDFSFPRVARRPGFSAIWMHQSHVSQRITAFKDHQTFMLWNFEKKNYRDLGEWDDKPLNLLCHLEDQPHHQHGNDGSHFGIAKCL